MIITFFWPSLIHFSETMIYFLAQDPAIQVRVVTQLEGDEHSEHPWGLRRLRQHGRVEIVDVATAAPQASDLLIFPLRRQGKMHPALGKWQALAKTSAFSPFNNFYADRKDWLRELIRSFPHYLKAEKAIFERGPKNRLWHLRFGLQKPVHYSPFVHPQFMVEPTLAEATFASVEAQMPRPFRLGFIGNRLPPERGARIAQCHRVLTESGSMDRAHWVEYGGPESTGPRGLPPMEYMAALAQMDVCISPPGWGLNWTHRTVEALVRGAIPMIEDPDLYSLGLKDGETCMLVKNKDWGEATRRALAMPETEILHMRQAVLALREELLLPEKAGARFRKALLA